MHAKVLFRGGPLFDLPGPEALAVSSGLITAIGSSSDLAGLIRPATRVVELRGRPLLPGFVDAHTHLDGYAQARQQLDLEGVQSLAEVARLVAERAAGLPTGAWILGRGWLRDGLERWPTAADLDPVSGSHPVALASHDVHALWVNSPALELA